MLHSERTRAHSQDSVGGGGFWCRFGFLVLYLCVSAFFAAIFEWGIGRFQERRVATVNNFFTRKFKKNEKVSKVRGGSGSAIGVVGLGHGAARRSCPPSTFSVCAFCFLTQITTGADVQYPARIEKTMTTARISAALQVTSGGGGAPRAPARARGARLPRRTRAGRDGGAAVPGMRKDGGMTVKIYTANCGNSPARSSPGAGAHGVMGVVGGLAWVGRVGWVGGVGWVGWVGRVGWVGLVGWVGGVGWVCWVGWVGSVGRSSVRNPS
jgi:hypothetical protein